MQQEGSGYNARPDACFTLACLSHGRCVPISANTCINILGLISFKHYYDESLTISVLEVVGNIVIWVNDSQIQFFMVLINFSVLNRIRRCLHHKYRMVHREACWIISNLIAGRHITFEKVIEAGVGGPLTGLLQEDDPCLTVEVELII